MTDTSTRVDSAHTNTADAASRVAEMTLEEKASLVTGATFWGTQGIERLGVPSITLTDGPHGVRMQKGAADHLGFNDSYPATAFPTASALGSSWDRVLANRVGAALAAEARSLGVDVLLGPGVNMKRSPLCGRNFEYFSEDPEHSGELGAAWVTGLQDGGVGASLKHFAANNQETNRMRVSAAVDERTLREIYFPAFERVVVEAQPATVMCSYNKVNGVYAAQNHWLLTEVLRDEWGFEGAVVSDWGAVWDALASLNAGLDLEMPANGATAGQIIAAVTDGRMDERVLDTAVARILSLANKFTTAEDPAAVDWDAHHQLAREVAAASAVLLKNDESLLPLNAASGGTIAVIGEFAVTPRYQGAGSSHIIPTRLDKALTAIQEAVDGQRDVLFAPGYSLTDVTPPSLIDDAVGLAAGADQVVLFLGLPDSAESEGFDRDTIDIPADHIELLRRVSAVNSQVVVVLSNGGVVSTAEVEAHAQAVLETWLTGQAGGSAIADVLFGAVNPSGRLAETIPLALSHNPAFVNFPGSGEEVIYGERVFIGYRWYDKVDRDVQHPFGFGLSYTTFAYSDLTVVIDDPTQAQARVSVTVTNTGDVFGAEVVQLYVADVEASVERPVRELRDFAKLHLAPGESATTEFTLDRRAFAYWDQAVRDWNVEPGVFGIEIGASSRDIRLRQEVTLTVTPLLPPLTLDSTVGEWMAQPIGKQVIQGALAQGGAGDTLSNPEMYRMIESMPVRKMFTMGGTVSDEDLLPMVAAANSGRGGLA